MTHLSLENRETIETALKGNKNFTEIGKLVNKHRTTIADEIIKHKIKQTPNTYGRNLVFCKHEATCNNYHGIGCTKRCSKYEPKECPKLNKPPYVCNGCKRKNSCTFVKYYYRSAEANKDYLSTLKESRDGIRLTQDEINKIDEVISPLILDNHQTVNQVYINHPDILYFSKTTFYQLVDAGLFSFRNIDLPRKVKYKKRKDGKKRRTREEAIIRVNRTYDDYLKYIDNHKNDYISIVQMDTVEGIKGGKYFLTLLLVQYNLMLVYLLDNQTTECVSKVFEMLKNTLGIELYKKIFQVVLTDNGHEFFAPENIEVDLNTGEILSHVFYCDPSRSDQKGAIEKNHEYIRYILPKKTSFDELTQKDCDELMSHINSVPRDSLKGNTPYKESLNFLNRETLDKLNIKEIEPDEVSLSPSLLKRKDRT